MEVKKVEYYELRLTEEEAEALWRLIGNTSPADRGRAVSQSEDELLVKIYQKLSNYFDDVPPF